MLTKLFGAAVQGIDATIVTIEVNSSRGIKFFLVGLPDSAVKESLMNASCLHCKSTVINFPPARLL